jgi:cytochrome P450
MIDDYTKKSGKPLSEEEEDNVKRMTGQLHTAAADTSYIVAATFILCMVLHPGVYDKVKSELDEVIGTGRLPTMEDKANLPYLDCVIKEVYRWNPPGPLGGIHSNLRDDEYNGYLIPKGSFVIANIWWMMNNPEIYSEPEEFKPERFAGTGSENLPNPKDIIFGFGRRICPGRYLAETNVFLTISHIAACFDIKKARDELGRDIDPLVEFTDGGTSCPKDFVCEITPRSDKIAELVKKDQEVD